MLIRGRFKMIPVKLIIGHKDDCDKRNEKSEKVKLIECLRP